jgi:hypothetical protein
VKFKLLRRRLSISAPRMTIKTHIPWPLRALTATVVLSVSIALGWWAYEAGKRFAGIGPDLEAEAVQLRQQVQTLTRERDRLAEASNAVESRLNIERSTQEQLARQAKSLEIENASLKDDLAFFEGLSGGAAAASGLAIKRFQIEPDSVPHQMRYRILLVKGGKSGKDFSGDLQFVLTLQQAGRTVMMTLPRQGDDTNGYRISFRFYKRVQGTFEIPSDAVLKQAQARILENGAVRAQQILMLS